jgi:hypothetical protein
MKNRKPGTDGTLSEFWAGGPPLYLRFPDVNSISSRFGGDDWEERIFEITIAHEQCGYKAARIELAEVVEEVFLGRR